VPRDNNYRGIFPEVRSLALPSCLSHDITYYEPSSLSRFAWLSIAAAILTIGLRLLPTC